MSKHEPRTPAGPSAPRAGTGWVDQAESAETLAAFADRVGAQQRKIAQGRPELHGCIGRGQHQKQLLGAFGMLHVDPDVPEVRLGPFARAAHYRVACRISNGQPCPERDQAPDVRGIALKFFTAEGRETDLVMTNEGGRSHARNAAQFTDVADILAALQLRRGALEALKEFTADMLHGSLGPIEAARVVAILGKETLLRSVESMATEHYWGSVVRLGDLALKYSAHPHTSTRPGAFADRKQPDYLREDLLHRLAEEPLRFEIALQLFADEESTPVHDASVAWKSPLVRVGLLEIPARPAEDDERLIDRMAFNPGNGFEPLGITHARKVAYAASAKNRGALTTDEIRRYFV